MISQDKREGFKLGIAFMLIAIAVAWLLGIANKQDQENKDALAQLHAGELSACWAEVKETGGTCRIEYIKDRTDTVIGAKVIREGSHD